MNLEEKTAIPASVIWSSGVALHSLSLADRKLLPEGISEHIGNFNLISIPIIAVGMLSVMQRKIKYIPEMFAAAFTAYTVAGESMYDILPSNTMDPKDIPATLVGAASAYAIVKYVQKKLQEKDVYTT